MSLHHENQRSLPLHAGHEPESHQRRPVSRTYPRILQPRRRGGYASNKYLPNNSYQLKKCNNGQWPEVCKKWAVYADRFKTADFAVYNVMYTD
ncbi:hypothetical protein MGU_08774 [Metarhizium guizhouense ARSEF 977]|uniref:Uncharacterized protein n=1 Tax=Metarhizium guizhouense (strain ARSEF 977) TaxID=1276136 RepID=A0A0B4GN50_METGA|nr:hypothetical protein MGU_08774 [Metarhizium guizhouense ARSEF 977]